MLFKPKKVKFTKTQKGRLRFEVKKQNVSRQHIPTFGEFSLFSCEYGFLTSAQIEASRRIIRASLQRKGVLWVNVFPHKPFTKKATGTRIGKGKGNVSFWASTIFPGIVLFEVNGVSLKAAKQAFQLVQKRLPLKTLISRRKKPLVLVFPV